jgi:hypothetical protein
MFLIIVIKSSHPTVPENLRKYGKRKNTPNLLFHSCFIETGFTSGDKPQAKTFLYTGVLCLRQTGGDIL